MYGLKGRIIAAIALVAGVLTALVASAQDAGLVTIIPERWKWLALMLPVIALFLTGFSERIQGGASDPIKRADAQAADQKAGKA